MALRPVSGDRIKQARQLRGLMLQRVAELIHKTKNELVRYESDLEQPSVETLERLAIVLSFPIGFFRQPPGPQFPEGSLAFHYTTEPEDAE